MNKIFSKLLILGAVSFSLVSCTQDLDSVGPAAESPREISFSCTLDPQTKAFSETTESTLQQNGFRCTAIVAGYKDPFFEEDVSYEGGKYVIKDKTYYDPIQNYTRYFCRYPKEYDVVAIIGSYAVEYTHNPDTDLVMARNTDYAEDGSIILNFFHALSQLSFKFKGLDQTVDYRIVSIDAKVHKDAKLSYYNHLVLDTDEYVFQSVLSEPSDVFQGSGYTSVGSPFSCIPSDVIIRIKWECMQKGTDLVVSSYDQSVQVEPKQSYHSTLNIGLPNSDAAPIPFSVSIDEWQSSDVNIDMEEDSDVIVFNFLADPELMGEPKLFNDSEVEMLGYGPYDFDGIGFKADKGMTWQQWVDSEYNTEGFIYMYDTVCTSDQRLRLFTEIPSRAFRSGPMSGRSYVFVG